MITEIDLKQSTPGVARDRMKALVYHGPGQRQWEDRPRPAVKEATDAVVRITTATICGTDLHILKGDVPSVTPGRILGHEGIGIVEEVGSAVTGVHSGDRVLISCITSCGKCDYCKKGMYSHCRAGGWILGNTIDGTQAEYVRIPHADNSLHHVPSGSDEDGLVMLSDILPTGFECGVLNGQVKPGDTVAIVGAGPIGLAVLVTAQFYSPAAVIMLDLDDNRLRVAQGFGATHVINTADGTAVERVMALTDGHRCRRRDRGRGSPCHVRHLSINPRAGRPSRQRGRARQTGRVAPREAVGPKHHVDDAARRHGDDADAAQSGAVGEVAAVDAGDAPLCALGCHESLRYVRKRRQGERLEGDPPGNALIPGWCKRVPSQ